MTKKCAAGEFGSVSVGGAAFVVEEDDVDGEGVGTSPVEVELDVVVAGGDAATATAATNPARSTASEIVTSDVFATIPLRVLTTCLLCRFPRSLREAGRAGLRSIRGLLPQLGPRSSGADRRRAAARRRRSETRQGRSRRSRRLRPRRGSSP